MILEQLQSPRLTFYTTAEGSITPLESRLKSWDLCFTLLREVQRTEDLTRGAEEAQCSRCFTSDLLWRHKLVNVHSWNDRLAEERERDHCRHRKTWQVLQKTVEKKVIPQRFYFYCNGRGEDCRLRSETFYDGFTPNDVPSPRLKTLVFRSLTGVSARSRHLHR